MILLFVGIVKADPTFYFEQNTTINLNVPCINCSTALCNISIFYPNSSTMVKNIAMVSQGSYFNYTTSNTGTLGEYLANVNCVQDAIYKNSIFSYVINKIGNNERPSNFMILAIILIFLIGLAMFVWAFMINGDNNYTWGSEGERILKINYGWYAKLFLFFMSYVCLWGLTFLCGDMLEKFSIYQTLAIITKWIFRIETYIIIPALITFTVLALMKYIGDADLMNLTKRGLKPR